VFVVLVRKDICPNQAVAQNIGEMVSKVIPHPFDGWIGRPEEKMSKHAETRMRNQSYPIIMNGHGSDHQRRRTTLIFGIFWSRDVKGMKRVWA
jgi:hypothetical protein